MSPRGFGNIDISAKVKKNEETVRIRPPGPLFKNLILQMYIRTYKIDMYVNNQHLPLTFVRIKELLLLAYFTHPMSCNVNFFPKIRI